jgi:hypothetical protein
MRSSHIEIVLEKVKEQENYLLKTRENLERRNINWLDNRTYNFERAKMIGMLDILDVLKIDRSQFNWIF